MNGGLLLQRLLDGLANGSLYGSLALAITLVYRATGRVNLAQGELATAGTYLALVLATPATPALAGTVFASHWLPGAPGHRCRRCWPPWRCQRRWPPPSNASCCGGCPRPTPAPPSA
ncbi:MAG: hypothetical protein R2749_10820 [Acidimicrobiales bacterium]